MPRLLGLDIGDVRIGVAVSDPMGMVATAVTTLDGRNRLAAQTEIRRLIREYEATRVIVGLPMNLRGEDTPQTQSVRAFAAALEPLLEADGVALELWDERMSTQQADRTLREMDTHRDKRKGIRDQIAAVLILQNRLDSGVG